MTRTPTRNHSLPHVTRLPSARPCEGRLVRSRSCPEGFDPETRPGHGGRDRPIPALPPSSEALRGFIQEHTVDRVKALRELGVDELRREHGFGPTFELGGLLGLALGLRVREKVYAPDDDAITCDPVKVLSNQTIAREGRYPLWLETGGVVELGGGMNGTIPLPGGAGIQVGFNTRALVRYRALRPEGVGGARPKTPAALLDAGRRLIRGTMPVLPLTPEAAARLPPGAELEIIGHGSLGGAAGLAWGTSIGLGPMEAAAGLRVSAHGCLNGTFSLRITGLDGKKLVRVVISNATSVEAGVSLAAQAGLSAALPIPEGDGLLAWLVNEDSGEGVLDELRCRLEGNIADHLGVRAGVDVQREWGRKFLVGFVLDMSQPSAARAFRDLLGLRIERARALALGDEPGVSNVTYREHSETSARSVSIRAFDQKIFLLSTVSQLRQGQLTGPNGEKICTNEGIFGKKFRTLLSGRKEIGWTAMTVAHPGIGKPETYYGLKFEAHDKIAHEQEVDTFRRFFASLQPTAVGAFDSAVAPMSQVQRAFSRRDDTRTEVELFFTPEAVSRIDAAGCDEGYAAYVEAAGLIHPWAAGFPPTDPSTPEEVREIFSKYREHKGIDPLVRMFTHCFSPSARLEGEYESATGRSLRQDFGLHQKARHFARLLGDLVQDDGPSVNRFFLGVGRTQGLEYMDAIAALARIAKPDATLVHALSMKGDMVHMEAKDEGELQVFSGADAVLNTVPGPGWRVRAVGPRS